MSGYLYMTSVLWPETQVEAWMAGSHAMSTGANGGGQRSLGVEAVAEASLLWIQKSNYYVMTSATHFG
jgi:hypothetical protein